MLVSPSDGETLQLSNQMKAWARAIKRDVTALWLAAGDSRVPWFAKAVAGLVAAYALSPIDLIPDFIPVLGYLDDLVIVPLGVLLAMRLVPPQLMVELRRDAMRQGKPASRGGLLLMLAIWTMAAVASAYWFWTLFS